MSTTIEHLPSENISIFPCAKPRTGSPQSNKLYEQSLTGLVKQFYLSGKEGLVITPESESYLTVEPGKETTKLTFTKDFEFSIGGYCCCIVEGTFIEVKTSEYDHSSYPLNGIYASILINSSTKEIEGEDEGGVYKGVKIVCCNSSTDKPTSGDDAAAGCQRIVLCLLERGTGEWVVPNSSRYNVLDYISGIDGRRT